MMKKMMFLAFAMVLFIGSVMAQEPQQGNQGGNRGPVNREQRMKMRMERLNQQLNLSEEQKAKVEALFNEQEDQRAKARDQQQSTDREAMRASFDKMRAEQDTKMKGILTPEQYTKYTEMNKNMGQRGGMGPREGMGQRAQDQVKEKAAEVKDDATKAKDKAAEKAAAKKAKKEAKLKKAAEEVK